MLLTKDYKDILNSKFDFYESIIEEINFINCSNLEIKVFYAFEPYKNKTLKIIFKDCKEYCVNNSTVIKNKKDYNIVTVHQEIEGICINEDSVLNVTFTTNFEKDYIKIKCSEICVEII